MIFLRIFQNMNSMFCYFLLFTIALNAFIFADPFVQDGPVERSFESSNQLIGGLVNPLNGQISLSEIDLIANGAQNLVLKRSYYAPTLRKEYGITKSSDQAGLAYNLTRAKGWIFFPHLLITMIQDVIVITEPDGSKLVFKEDYLGNIKLLSDSGSRNSDGFVISSQFDARNTKCSRNDDTITIHSKDGTIRYYERGQSLGNEKWNFYLTEEKLPNGRWIIYTYSNDLEKLISIEARDPYKHFIYSKLFRCQNGWNTHTGLEARYDFNVFSSKGLWFNWWPPGAGGYDSHHFFLKKVDSPFCKKEYAQTSRGNLHFCYDQFSSKYETSLEALRVSQIELPVGENDENVVTHNIFYSDRLVMSKNPDGTKTFYSYNKDFCLVKMSHAKQLTRFRWDNGYLKSTEVKGLYKKEYECDSCGNPVLERYIGDFGEHVIHREYEKNLLVKEDTEESTTLYSYLQDTNLITSKTTNGRCEYFKYDEYNNLIESFTNNQLTKYILFPEGPHVHKVEWIIKHDRMVQYDYDQHGYIAKEKHYDKNGDYLYTLYKTCNERGNLFSETDPYGKEYFYEYDKEGRLLSSTKTKQRFTYDTRGRLTSSSDPLYETTYKYNIADQLIEKTDRFGTCYYEYKDGCLVKTIDKDRIYAFSYDIYGRKISSTDPNGNTTYYEYNSRGQIVKTLYPDGTYTTCTYYPNGRLKSEQDKDENTISYVYDGFGRVIKKIYDSIGEETFTFDDWNLLSMQDLEGYTTYYSYDDFGRKIKEM
ncbi:MAG: RHS repeat protein, partial [Chlamydiae bacterium]|nr:RHS repeat protein [Chlamydiota bacterium]